MWLKGGKCAFMQKEVEYLGHRVDAQGPAPIDVTELKAYLGLLNYHNRFLPNLATLLAPLHGLLRQNINLSWQKKEDEAFQKSKTLLNLAHVLIHYSADRELLLSCDMSPYSVGAVLSHRMDDGSEKPLLTC